MKILKNISVFACIIATMAGCLDNNTGSDTTPELVTRENYYITNQSESDLTLTYKIASADMDSTVAVPADSTTKIFENGGIGNSSTPSSSFASLRFYKKAGDRTSPLLTIEPIVNENWNFTAGGDDEPAKYELVITEEDIK